MNYKEQVRLQFWVLLLITILFFLTAPTVWRYTPDSGIYIGTAVSMIKTGQYRFNGYPNLQYYPGFSSLLCLPILLFGVKFHVLHLLCIAIAIVSLWLARAYFPPSRYGITGIVVPVLMACTAVFQTQVFRILSDGAFVTISLGALLLWRTYIEKSYRWALIACFVLVAFAPLVRFHGLFLCAAFFMALVLEEFYKTQRSALKMFMAITAGLSTLIPFAAWTWRNVKQFTPHTFNMANNFFFGQKGLSLYAPGFGKVAWINAEWKYPLYNIVYSVRTLGKSVFGESIVTLLSPKTVFIFIVSIIFAGSLPWFKRATYMEKFYVILCALFVLFWLGRSHSLYASTIAPRHLYLPFLPFILISAGLGLEFIHEKLKKTRYQFLPNIIIGFLILLVLSNGVNTLSSKHLAPYKKDFFKNATQVTAKVKHFMDEKTIPGVPVATTDWGVMPFTLNRTCYQVLNDESHLLTLRRMEKYQTGYLVILDRLTAFSTYARKMVTDFPHLFNLLLEVKPDNGPSAAVYEVDLQSIGVFLHAKANIDF